MEILADEMESTSINVKGLLPGIVKTAFRTRAFPAEDSSTLTRPEEIAKAAAFLLGSDSNTINNESSNGRTFQLDELISYVS